MKYIHGYLDKYAQPVCKYSSEYLVKYLSSPINYPVYMGGLRA